MATKREVLEQLVRGEGCLAKAKDDEPVFVLVGHDALAAETVERWALRARAMGVNNDKVQGAQAVAEEMQQWHTRRAPD